MTNMKYRLRLLTVATLLTSTALVAGCGSTEKVTKTTTTEQTTTSTVPALAPAPDSSFTTTTTTQQTRP